MCIFLNENVWTPIKISLKCVPKGPINNIPALVQIMALRRPGDKPLSEPMMVRLPTHICVTRPQWVKYEQLGASVNFDDLFTFGDRRQIRRSGMFKKFAFEFRMRCHVIFISHPIKPSLGGKCQSLPLNIHFSQTKHFNRCSLTAKWFRH